MNLITFLEKTAAKTAAFLEADGLSRSIRFLFPPGLNFEAISADTIENALFSSWMEF